MTDNPRLRTQASAKVPAGFEAATAQAGIRTSAQMGAAVRADLALLAERGRLPCDVRNGTTKCEACADEGVLLLSLPNS